VDLAEGVDGFAHLRRAGPSQSRARHDAEPDLDLVEPKA
jgi:hypothetical protein